MKSWTIALAAAAIITLTSAMPFDNNDLTAGKEPPALTMSNNAATELLKPGKETSITFWSAASPQSRIENNKLSESDKSHIGINIDDDIRLASTILKLDGTDSSRQYSRNQISRQSLRDYIGNETPCTVRIAPDGQIISITTHS